MKVSTKLSTAFCLAAVFLLVVEIAAVIVVDRLNSILAATNHANLQAGQVAEALQAYRLAPQRRADLGARLDDLERLARTPAENDLITKARQGLTTGQPMVALEELGTLYRQAIFKNSTRLQTIHHWTTIGLIVIMLDSVLLFVGLTWLVRRWLLRPLGFMNHGVAALAAVDLARQVSPIGDEEFITIINNINKLAGELTALREAGERTQHLANMGEACSHVTHNVRSLLGSIRSLAQYESNASDVDPDSRVGFNYIIALVNKLDQWVRALHSTVSPLNPAVAPHRIEPIVHDAIALLEPQVTEKNLRVDYRTDDALPRAVIDRGLFEQAFLAVLSNAIQASPADGQIDVLLKNGSPDRVTLLIEDRGPGMSDDVRQRVFDPYFTTKPESAGLGLTIARAIMKRHGGEIEIDSVANQGTRVRLHFPAAKQTSV
ncbi:MAG: ATP-binding protein [Verrucomicrobiota bacterium]